MIPIRTCIEDKCNTVPTFNVEGQPPRYYAKHKTKDMIDVRSKLCEWDGCIIHPYFGFPNKKATRCYTHQSPVFVQNV